MKECQQELAAIYNNIPVVILTMDEDRRVHKANRATELFTGVPVTELAGLRAGEVLGCIHKNDDPEGCGFGPACADCPVRLTVLDTIETGNSHHQIEANRTLVINGKAEKLTFLLSTSRLELNGEPRAIVSLEDITSRKRAEEDIKRQNAALKETAAKLKQSNDDLQQFAEMASHDLQEPLRTMTGFLQMLERRFSGDLDVSARELIELAVDGAGRMQSIIDGLLDYSRVGTVDIDMKDVDMKRVISQTLKSMTAAVRESGANISHGALPAVKGDASLMSLLLQNLIGNAIKFRGDLPPNIHIEAAPKSGWWQFSVADNGIGLEPRFGQRIFMMFQRGHNSLEYPGTGIGLAICQRIVEKHNGRIWVESKPGRGATFFFTLPAP